MTNWNADEINYPGGEKLHQIDTVILEEVLKREELDVILSLSEQTRKWFLNINTSEGVLFIEPSKSHFFVDGKYIEYVKNQVKEPKVSIQSFETIEGFTSKTNYKRIGVEAEYLTLHQLSLIKSWYPNADIVQVYSKRIRMIKSKTEINNIQIANNIAMKAMEKLKPMIKPGVTEKELDANLEKFIRELGAKKSSFDTIIVSGIRGSLPHGVPTNRTLRGGELVTIDFGALYNGYASDITRTFHVGNVSDPKLLEIESIVREAQRLGREAVKPGVSTFEIDKICRDYITEKGYGEYFFHTTGHGLGIDVHELPLVSKNKETETILKAGMVITVEPGIYIEGVGGVRIEDDILVTDDGNLNFSRTLLDY